LDTQAASAGPAMGQQQAGGGGWREGVAGGRVGRAGPAWGLRHQKHKEPEQGPEPRQRGKGARARRAAAPHPRCGAPTAAQHRVPPAAQA
jgi:hypothetical protein